MTELIRAIKPSSYVFLVSPSLRSTQIISFQAIGKDSPCVTTLCVPMLHVTCYTCRKNRYSAQPS